jgi:hypothetical protein
MKAQLIALVPYAAAVFVFLTGYLLVLLLRYINANVKNVTLRGLLSRAVEEIRTLVEQQAQVVDNKRGPDGRLSIEEAKLARAEVMQNFKNLWGKQGLSKLVKVIDIESEQLDDWLAARVDSAVRLDKVTTAPVKEAKDFAKIAKDSKFTGLSDLK